MCWWPGLVRRDGRWRAELPATANAPALLRSVVSTPPHRGVALFCVGVTLTGMPTGRPRHTLTETDEITAALADATARWPGLSPTELLKRLVAEGHAVLRASLDALRQDWPA